MLYKVNEAVNGNTNENAKTQQQYLQVYGNGCDFVWIMGVMMDKFGKNCSVMHMQDILKTFDL